MKSRININIFIKFIILTIVTMHNVNAQSNPIAVTPSPAYYGKIPISSSEIVGFYLLNMNTSDVNITDISFTGEGASKFSVVNDPQPSSIGSYDEIILNVKYIPTTIGEDTAVLNIVTSAGTTTVNLSAYGTEIVNGVATFERLIGLSEDIDNRSTQLTQTVNGDFVIAARTKLPNFLFEDIFLTKTDQYGKEIWSKLYEFGNWGGEIYDAGVDHALDIIALADESIVVLGTTNAGGPGSISVILTKWDKDGNFLWENVYGGIYDDICNNLIQDSQGNFLVVGNTNNTADDSKNTLVMKISSDGTLIWNKNYGTAGIEGGFDIIEASEGGYILVGNNQNPIANIYFIKLDNEGNEEWSRTLANTHNCEGSVLRKTSDGGYVISGYILTDDFGPQGYLVKVNSSMDLQWSKTFGEAYFDYFKSVVETVDGGYLCVGANNIVTTNEHVYDDAWLIKTDSQGNLLWEKLYGGELNEFASDVILNKDGGYTLAGESASYRAKENLYFISVNSNGDITDGSVTGVEERIGNKIPIKFSLAQNYPNPFNPSTIIQFDVSDVKSNHVLLIVYDALGKEIATLINKELSIGRYSVEFNANSLPDKNLASGIYFYRLINGSNSITKKMMLLK